MSFWEIKCVIKLKNISIHYILFHKYFITTFEESSAKNVAYVNMLCVCEYQPINRYWNFCPISVLALIPKNPVSGSDFKCRTSVTEFKHFQSFSVKLFLSLCKYVISLCGGDWRSTLSFFFLFRLINNSLGLSRY